MQFETADHLLGQCQEPEHDALEWEKAQQIEQFRELVHMLSGVKSHADAAAGPGADA
jgi:hypothetical protein